MKRTPLKRSSRRRTDKQAAAEWWDTVMRKTRGRCWINPEVWANDAHHVIPKQSLRTRGLPLWDARNGIPLSRRVHERHTTAVERITRDRLPAEALEFAAEYGLTHLIERYYPESARS